ncbi:putative GINS complex subunit Sld5, GINS, helical bundle-like domain superfamily protein [Helianthus anomalus]
MLISFHLQIEKFMFHIQKTEDLWARLSRQEQKFAKQSIEDLKTHLEQSVLSKLPDRYQSHLKQSVISEEADMGIFFYLNCTYIQIIMFANNLISVFS